MIPDDAPPQRPQAADDPHRAGQLAETAEHCAAVLATEPENAAALYRMGTLAWQHGRHFEAATRLSRAVSLDPEIPDGHTQLLRLLEVFLASAEAERARGGLDRCAALYAFVLERKVTSICACVVREWYPLAAADGLKQALQRVEQAVREARERGAPLPDADRLQGLIDLELGRPRQGTRLLQAVADRGIADAEQQQAIGLILLAHKQYDEAIALLRRALVLEPGRVDACHGIGKAFYRLGRFGRSAAALERTVAISPRHAAAWVDLGYARHAQRRHDDAVASFDAALRWHPTSAWAVLGIAAVHLVRGAQTQAAEAFERAKALAPALAEPYIGLGSLLIGTDRGRALSFFTESVNRKFGQQHSPLPRGPGMYESLRGYFDALYGVLAEAARSLPPAVEPAVREIGGDTFADHQPVVGRLTPFAAVPNDGRFHPRDPAGRISTLRLEPARVIPLAPPFNYEPEVHDSRFYECVMLQIAERVYERAAWHQRYPFPRYAGSEGVFLSRIDGCRFRNACSLYSTAGDFFEESRLFDEGFLPSGSGSLGFRWDEDRYRIRMPHPPSRIMAPHNVLGGMHAHHYASWLVCIAAKLHIYQTHEETRDHPFVLNRRVYEEARFAREILEAFGVPRERLLLVGNGTFELDRAYCASTTEWYYSPFGTEAVRRRLLEAYGIPEKPRGSRIFYVSRRDAYARQILNEDEIIEYLSRYGVTVVTNSELSVREIAELFSDARCVIGAAGAGLANVLFSPPGTTVIDLTNDTMIEPMYWMMCTQLRHRYGILIEDRLNRLGDYVVPLSRFRALFEAIA
ncbi:glycosyltransferase 61 family protein [Azospirillum sp.]|uniref:glycosyltransferase 61 family protein n=1 Tax=Azospirillum sp. TaxID=34012 RepID=UPI003D7488AD